MGGPGLGRASLQKDRKSFSLEKGVEWRKLRATISTARSTTYGLPDLLTDEQFQKEWKISKAKEEELLAQFKATLKEADLLKAEWDFWDIYMLRRFLRARQHDIPRAKEFWAQHIKWRQEFGVDELDKFHFHERDAFISLYPQGYHKTDKMGRPVFIQHLGAINLKRIHELTNEERMLKFHVQEYERCVHLIMPACSKVKGSHIDQTLAIIDVKGVGLSHISQVRKVMGKILAIDQNNYPEMLGKTCIINAPGLFKTVFALVKPMLDPRTLSKIEVCGSNFTPTLLKYVDKENLPEYLGGTSTATLVDDAGPWQDPKIVAEIEEDLRNQKQRRGTQDTKAGEPVADVCASATAGQAGLIGAPRTSREVGDRTASTRAPLATIASGTPEALGPPGTPFAEAVHQRASGALSSAASDDSGYYSPRSYSSSMVSADSFSGRGAPDDAEPAGALSSEDLKGDSPEASTRQASIQQRIRVLQAALPGLHKRLQQHLEPEQNAEIGDICSASDLGSGPMLERLAALEDAVDLLLAAQELQAQHEAEESDRARSSCCGCCVM